MQTNNLLRVILEFVGVVLMPEIHIRLVQVVAFLDCGVIDFGVLANLFCNARDVAGIFELYHKMVMWLFEVAYLPIRAVAVMVFAVVEKFLLGMCIFVM